ncbi:MAG: SulP family inorganic anion transporter [Nitrospira sp.]|nr:SulP family inorganic anion transporter [Nitrospira sp.]MDE0405827.1 SulP family inorganic anion transporter [Nitrospira sp.]MDE0486399.1 SulP family inorganic anion transporter [Nitrospira sp.]
MKSPLRQLADVLRADIPPSARLPALSVGISSGLTLLAIQVAYGTFIFSGPLAPHSYQGVGLVLFGNFAACLLIALFGGYRGAISGLSLLLVFVMSTIAATMEAEGEKLFATTACALTISAVATGVCCLLIGRFRLANLLRFIPYPVAGGFVAGIGGAVCLAALSLMNANPDGSTASALLEPTALWTWLPGFAYGIALYAAQRRWENPFILPTSVILAIGAYHLALSALGLSGDEARAAGLLLTSTAQGNLWPALWPADLVYVDWSAIVGQLPNMLTLVVIALICVIMNTAGLEVATDADLDWDREFQVTGTASIVTGLGGGMVATVIVPASFRSKLFRATSRLTGVIAACVVGTALLLGDGMLELVPTAYIGAMLVFTGLGMLDEGLVRSRKHLPGSEYAIIFLIFVVIIFFGLLEGVGAGAVATLVFFAVRLSRVDPIASHFTARKHRSNKARSIPDRTILLAEGDQVQAYQLQGYIFFGSVGALADGLTKSLEGPSRASCLMIDFTHVSGFDFSAVNVVARSVRRANTAGVQVVLSGLSEKLRLSLERNVAPAVFAELWLEPNTDLGLERCEELIIAAWRADAAKMEQRRTSLLERTAEDLERQLERQVHFEDLIEALQPWLASRDYAAKEILASSGIPCEGLQLLVSGHASVQDSAGTRLRQCRPGDVIWLADPTAGVRTTVVADEPCRAMLLTPSARRWLEEHEQGLIIDLYRYMFADHFGTGPDHSLPQNGNYQE